MKDDRQQETETSTNREVVSTESKRTISPTPTNRGVVSTSDQEPISTTLANRELTSIASTSRELISTRGEETILPDSTDRGVISTEPPNEAATSTEPTFSDLKRDRALVVLLHWLSATTVAYGSPDDVVAFISGVLGHSPEVYPWGQNFYTTTYKWAGGLKLLHNENRSELGLHLMADGGTCEFYGLAMLAYIYQALQFRATRIDLAVDGCRFTPSSLRNLWLKDWVRTQARPVKDAKPGREAYRRYKWVDTPTGDTFYMGSDMSTQYARCYNLRGFTRFEMVLKQERAAQVMQALCVGAELAPTLGAVISQFVAFVMLNDSNRSRCTPLPFWARFIESLTTNGVVTRLEARPGPTVNRLIERVETQFAPLLVVYGLVKGGQDNHEAACRELWRRGLELARPRHHALISAGDGWRSEHGTPLPEIVQDAPPHTPGSDEPVEEDAA